VLTPSLYGSGPLAGPGACPGGRVSEAGAPAYDAGVALPPEPLVTDEPIVPALRQPRVFYGWWIVIGAFVAQFVAIGTQSPVAGAFLVPMTEDLGWERAEFTIAISLATALSAVVGFLIGGHVDRYGARPLMLIGSFILAASIAAISQVDALWQFILLRGVAFTLGFTLIGNLVVNVTLSKWFVEKRGWAISLASMGVSAGSVILTPIMVSVVDRVGWRDAWLILAAGAFVLVFPVALIMRRQPEDYGLAPDGARGGDGEREVASRARAAADFANSFTRAQAIRTPAMWLLVVAFGFSSVGLVSLLFHAVPFLTDYGFPRTEAALFFSLQGAAALLSKFVWGWSMQHFPPRLLAAGSFVCAGTGAVLMVVAGQEGARPLMMLAFVLFGAGIGGQIPLNEFIWANFFGRRHLGSVRAAAMPVTILFSAGGPYFASVYYDVLGSYDGAILTFGGLWAAAALLVLIARPPRHPLAALADIASEEPALPVVTSKPSARVEPVVDLDERAAVHHVAAFGLPPEVAPAPSGESRGAEPAGASPENAIVTPPAPPAFVPPPPAAPVAAPPSSASAPAAVPAAEGAVPLERFEVAIGRPGASDEGWGRWGETDASAPRPAPVTPSPVPAEVDQVPVAVTPRPEPPEPPVDVPQVAAPSAAGPSPRAPRAVEVRRSNLPARLDAGTLEVSLGDAARLLRHPKVGAGAAAAAVTVAWLLSRRKG
jgi:OFA family oxalate/formate antiporter-like MFS transporter